MHKIAVHVVQSLIAGTIHTVHLPLAVATLSWLIFSTFGVSFADVYDDLAETNKAEEAKNIWEATFPLHATCEWSHNSMVPGRLDRYSSGCDIRLNGVRKNIIQADLWFLTMLGSLGILHFCAKLIVFMLKPLRQCTLQCLSGCHSPDNALRALAKNLGYCDFVVLMGIGNQVSAHVFNSVCVSVQNQMYQIDEMEMNSINTSPDEEIPDINI